MRHWTRLEQRARGARPPAAAADGGRVAWWAGYGDAIAAAVASVLKHRERFEADPDLGLYAWWLGETPGPEALLGFLDDVAATRRCDDCGADRTMVVRDEHGRGRCPRHGGHRALAATATGLLPLAAELTRRRRASR